MYCYIATLVIIYVYVLIFIFVRVSCWWFFFTSCSLTMLQQYAYHINPVYYSVQ